MTFLADDFKRQVYGDCKLYVAGINDVKGLQRQRLFDCVWEETHSCINKGLRDERKIRRQVLRTAREKYGSVVLLMVIAGIVSFVVQRILERLFPKD